MAYRDELEALRARLAAAEAELTQAREETGRLRTALSRRTLARGSQERALAPERTPSVLRSADFRWRSIPGGEPTPVTLINESERKVEVFWLSYEGRERSAGTLVPGGRVRAQTYVGHCWRFVDAETGEVLAHEHVRILAGEPVIAYRDVDTTVF